MDKRPYDKSVFELEDGKVYEAQHFGRTLTRKFYKKDGHLYNDSGTKERGRSVGCSFIPPGEEFKFREAKNAPTPEIEAPAKIVARDWETVMTLKPGLIYDWENGYLSSRNNVALFSNVLYFVDKHGNKGAKVTQDKILSTDKFRIIGTIVPVDAPAKAEVPKARAKTKVHAMVER